MHECLVSKYRCSVSICYGCLATTHDWIVIFAHGCSLLIQQKKRIPPVCMMLSVHMIRKNEITIKAWLLLIIAKNLYTETIYGHGKLTA